jgi:hypothetical protein
MQSEGARVMTAGPRFLTTMQIPILAGREIDDRDQPGSAPVAVIRLVDAKREVEIIGVSANLRTGGLKSGER